MTQALEPLEAPNPDKLNVKTEALPQSSVFLYNDCLDEKNEKKIRLVVTYKLHQISEECKILLESLVFVQ